MHHKCVSLPGIFNLSAVSVLNCSWMRYAIRFITFQLNAHISVPAISQYTEWLSWSVLCAYAYVTGCGSCNTSSLATGVLCLEKKCLQKLKEQTKKYKAHVLGYECSYYSFLIALGKRACSVKRFVDLVVYNAQIHMLTNSLCCLSQPGIFNLVTVSILLCLWIGVTIINARIFISVIITIHRVTIMIDIHGACVLT